jgi:hypothetical protein
MKIENNVDNTLKNCCRFEQAILARGCVNIKKFICFMKIENNILNDKNVNPYYICVPMYLNRSAGIKVLHYLCHHLNLNGYPAFIVDTGYFKNEEESYTNLNLITPILSNDHFKYHINEGKKPIYIISDTFLDKKKELILNKNAKCVRYMLSYEGHLCGNLIDRKNELIFSFSKDIAKRDNFDQNNIFFFPTFNSEIFHENDNHNAKTRSGVMHYLGKYKCIHNGKPNLVKGKENIIITRVPGDLNYQTTNEMADILRNVECCFIYEDTAVITEAIMCGCPVFLIKNEFCNFEHRIALSELSSFGISLNDYSDDELLKLQQEIPLAQKQIQHTIDNFYPSLESFITKTQEYSQSFDIADYNINIFNQLTIKNLLINLVRIVSNKYPKLKFFKPYIRIVIKIISKIKKFY